MPKEDIELLPPPLNKRGAFASSTTLNQLRDQVKLEPEEELDELPPLKKRKCTDFLLLLLFATYWAGMIGFGVLGYVNGDPLRLIYGSAYNGKVCGEGDNLGKPFLAFPRIELDVLQAASEDPAAAAFYGVCVNQCPQENDFVCNDEGTAFVDAIIESSGQFRSNVIANCLANPLDTDCLDVFRNCFDTVFNTTSFLFRCFPEYKYESVVLNDESGCLEAKEITVLGVTTSVCQKFRKVSKVTEEEPPNGNFLFDAFNSVSRFAQVILGDILKTYDVILAVGIGISAGVGLLYVFALWCCVKTFVWFSIAMCGLVLVCFTLFCYVRAGLVDLSFVNVVTDLIVNDEGVGDLANSLGIDLDDVSGLVGDNATNTSVSISSGVVNVLPDVLLEASSNTATEFETGAYVMSAITILYFLIICLLFGRIRRAIEIFQEASHAIRSNPLLLLIPAFQGGFLIALICYSVVAMGYVYTSGEVIDIPGVNLTIDAASTAAFLTTEYGTYSYSQVGVGYLFLGMLWSINFINGITIMIVAGAVAKWYWAGGGGSRAVDLGLRNLCTSTHRTIRYHLGTVAFGALLIAIIQFVRYIAHYIQSKMKDLQGKSRMVKILLCCLNCCLACAEKCIKFISRNGYIMCAIYGKTFCTSSKMAFFAIAHNIAQVAAVTFLGDIITRVGQVLITATSSLAAWAWLANDPRYQFGGSLEIDSVLVPVSVVALFAWVISAEILAIYDIAVDTILLSYCQDKKLLDRRGKTHAKLKDTGAYASFHNFVGKHGQTDEEFEQSMKGASIRPF